MVGRERSQETKIDQIKAVGGETVDGLFVI